VNKLHESFELRVIDTKREENKQYQKEEKAETIDCGEQQKAVCSRLLFNTIMMDTFVFDTTI